MRGTSVDGIKWWREGWGEQRLENCFAWSLNYRISVKLPPLSAPILSHKPLLSTTPWPLSPDHHPHTPLIRPPFPILLIFSFPPYLPYMVQYSTYLSHLITSAAPGHLHLSCPSLRCYSHPTLTHLIPSTSPSLITWIHWTCARSPTLYWWSSPLHPFSPDEGMWLKFWPSISFHGSSLICLQQFALWFPWNILLSYKCAKRANYLYCEISNALVCISSILKIFLNIQKPIFLFF